MSAIVRCSGCAARFGISPEQLGAADGWVRCGACGQVFDAARQAGAPAAHANRFMSDRRHASPQPASARPAAGNGNTAAPLLRRASSDVSGLSGSSESAAATDDAAELDRDPRPASVAGNAAWPATARNSAAARLRMTTGSAALTGASTTGFGHQALSFMRDASDGKRHMVAPLRWLINLAVLLLSGVLLAQVVLQHRDWLAARAPAFEPLLQRLCDPLGCTIGPPRQIDALVIGNSSLTRLGETGYRLSLALRNQADTGMATPSVELTLTDAADRTLVRRVLMPADLGAARSIAARGEWVGALTFVLTGAHERIAGYRVTAFYP